MLNLTFNNGTPPALNARNMNAIVESINALGYAVGGPNVASTVSAMTDTSKVYVYTGSETGYTAGNWYYYNGSTWVSGGVYQATAVETDTTLTMPGEPADAKATGDEVADLKNDLEYNTGTYEPTLPWITGKYYILATSAGGVDIADPTGTGSYQCAFLPCEEGDVFYVTAKGASAARPWAFLSSSSGEGNIISRTIGSYDLTNEKIVAPYGAEYVVFNASTNNPCRIISGEYLVETVMDTERVVGDLYNTSFETALENGHIVTSLVQSGWYYDTVTGSKRQYDGYCCSPELIHVSSSFQGCVFRSLSPSYFHICCWDNNKNFIGNVIAATYNNVVLNPTCIPIGTHYIAFSCSSALDSFELQLVGGSDVAEYPFSGDGYIYRPGYWCNIEGVVSAVETADTIFMPGIKAGDQWYTNVSGDVVVVWFDADNVVISVGEGVEVPYHGYVFTAPENCSYAYFNFLKDKTHGGVPSSVFFKITKPESVLCIGDSITYLDGRSGFDDSTRFLGYQKVIQRAGYKTESYGYSGYTYATGVMDGSTPIGSIYTQVVTNELDVSGYDVIVLSGGSNDDLYGVDIGEVPTGYQNVTYDTTTMLGALGAIIAYIRTHNVTCKIVLCTILKSQAGRRPFYESKLYAQAIRDMANYASCYLCDNYMDYNVQPFTEGWDDFFYDSSHPNKTGMKRLGKLMLNAIELS